MEQEQFITIEGLFPNEVLLNKHKQFGLWLARAPADADIINLIYRGSAVASFPASTVTVEEIRKTTNKIMEVTT